MATVTKIAPAERTLPCDIESEKVLLGTALLNSKAILIISDILDPGDFYLENHRIVYRRMLALLAERTGIDVYTVRSELDRNGELEKVGGMPFLFTLTDGMGTAANVKHYAHVVRERSVSRRLISLGNQLQAEAWSGEDPPRVVLERIQTELIGLYGREQDEGLKPMDEVCTNGYRELVDRSTAGNGLGSISTGLYDLDSATGGFRSGNLIIIAGRPGSGKSALSVNIAVHAAGIGCKCAIFSLEMSQSEVYVRMIAADAGLNCSGLIRGYVRRDQWTAIHETSEQISKLPIWMDDSGSLTMMQLRARAMRMQMEFGIDLLIVDYLQLVQGTGKERSIYERVTEVSRGLKILAKDLKIPVIALSQLHRLQNGENQEPNLSDLKESGAIEQDADLVLFLWAETGRERYRKCKVGKQRNGPLSTMELGWLADNVKFINSVHSEA